MKRLLLLLSLVGFWQISYAQCPPVAPLPTPLYENFDSQASGQTGVFANCWTANTTADPNWETKTGTTSSSNTGPSSDFSGTGTYVYMETSGGALGAVGELATPPISLAGLTVPELRFHYHMYGATMGTLDVQVWDGLTWTSVWMRVGEQQTSLTDPWIEAIVDLSTYTGTIEIKFVGTRGSSFTGDMAVDEFKVQEAPACPQPGNLAVTNVTSTGADVSWNTVAAASAGYEVIYGAAGFNPASGGTSATSATTTYTVAGLAGNTAYEAYIIADCALSGISDTSGPIAFTTLCASQPSGTVTIDPALPASATNYQSFSALAVDVNQCGIGGPVTVNVKEGVYNEQVTFGSFIGTSVTNTVVIQPDPANTLPVVLTYSPTTSATTENFTLNLNGAQNMEFKGMTIQSGGTLYSRVIQFGGTCDNISFDGNTINGASVTTTSTFNALFYYLNPVSLEGVTINNNTLNNGSYAAYLSLGTSPISDNLVITNNTVNGSYSGFYLSNFKNANFSNNTLNLAASTTTQYGVRLYGSSTVTSEQVIMEENQFNLNSTGTTYGAYIGYYVATAVAPSRIQNNFISNAATTGTGTRYMIYPYACDYLNIYHNSINLLDGSATAGRAIYLNTSTSATIISGNVDVRNNIISHTGAGYAIEIATAAVTTGYVTTMSNNLYNYDVSNTTAFRLGTTNYANLAAWQVASTLDANSAEGDPVFTSVSDLHALGTAANDIGDNTAGVTTDIDGEARPATGSTTVDIGADEYTPASCAPPSGLAVYGETSSSAMVTWTTGGATVWGVEYGAAGFTLGSGTYVAATNDTIMLSGLMSQTTYDVYVKDSCSTSSVSPSVGPVSFTTTCAPVTAPYSEDFETGFTPGSFGPSISTCLFSQNTSNPRWEVEDASGANENSTGTGPFYDNTLFGSSGGHYLYLETSGGTTGSTDILTTPFIDISNLSVPFLGFSYHMYGAAMGTLKVEVWDNGAWAALDSVVGQQQTAGSDPWNNWTDTLNVTSDTIRLRFVGIRGTSFTSDMSIDDLFLIEAPSCSPPANLGVTNVTGFAADIYWTTGGASNWQIEYGVSGFTPGTGTLIAASNDTTTLSGLTPGTSYTAYVRDSCAVGQVSLWAGPVSFSTLCAPLATPSFENFEAGYSAGSVGPSISSCFNSVRTSNPRWEVEDASGSNENSTGTGPLYDNTTPGVAGGHYLYLETSGGAGLSDTLTTPEYDVSGLTLPYFEFAYHMFGATMGVLSVEVWDGTTWSAVTTLSGQQQSVQSDPWLISGTPINGLTSTVIKFRFIGTSGTSFTSDMSLDDIAVYESPSCFKPTAPGVVTTDDQNATIYWTGGGASNWNVQYGPAGFTPGSGTIVNATNDTITLTGLTATTAYEFYVRDSCGLGDVSLWAGPTAFTTSACSAASTCTYSADLFDSFGDGWNGAQVTVWQGGVAVATLGAGFTTGNSFAESFDVCDGLMTYVTLSAAGSFPSEVGIYVKDRAGDTVVSYPNSGATSTGDTLGMFTVDCSKCGVFSAPFTETFEASSPSASCWSNEYVADTFDWTLGTGSSGGAISAAHGGAQNAVFVSANGGPDITRYVSPQVDIATLLAPELRFWYGQEVWFGDQNYLNVYYRTDTASAWMLLWSDSTDQPAWTEAIVTLPNPSATYQLGFEGINNWGRANVLDDVTIMDAPACPAPTMLGVTNITDVTADIYWTGGGSATNWLIKYDDGTTTNITTSANDTTTLTGLTPGTGYTVHVKDSCGAGNVSVWAGPLTFNTALCAAANSCNYSALLTDAFGDGWNGAEVTVYQNGVAVQVLGTNFVGGSTFGPVSVPLCDGLSTDFVLTTAGAWPSEVGMDLDDSYGLFVASYAASGATIQGDTLISITSSCAAPACVPPANLGAFNVTTNSADLFWTGSSGAMMYNVQYGVQGFTPGTGTIVNSANDTLNLTGISSSQCYDFWVQADCGTDSSFYVGPYSFCTLCAPISTFPYTEGFGNAPVTTLPACYSDSSTSTGTIFMWTVDAGGTGTSTSGPAVDASGSATGNYVYTEASGPNPGDSAFLYLPEFDITSLTTPELVFQYHMYGADITVLTLEVYNAGSGSWTAVDSIVGQQQTGSADAWLERRFDLTALSSSSLLMRFLHVRGASFAGDASLDDITIRETPLCVDPTALMVTGVGQTSVDLSWMTDTNITSSSVQYGPVGFAIGSGTTVSSAAGIASVTGLMMNTCYDFYVQDNCSSTTNWVGPVTACTKPGCGVSGVPTNVMGDSTGCGGGGVTMTGTPASGNQIGWFVNGTIVGSGSPFIDTIGVTTNYEARNISRDGSAYHLGPQPSIAASGFGNFTNGQYITVMDTLIIDSTTVRSNGLVEAQVIIMDPGATTILQRGEIFTTPAAGTVNTQVAVGIVLLPGNYFIGIDYLPNTVGSLFRATAGAVYPYVFPGLMSIDSVNFAGPRYYYTFDLVIQNACISTVGLNAIGYVPGANAGTSDSVVVCETNSAVDLTSFLGVYDAGGTWSDDDATGALTDSIFDASAVAAGGTYNFSYIVTQSGGCVGGDTSIVSVTVEASPFAGNDTTNAVCITGAPLQLRALLPGSDNGGSMTDLDGSGALVGTLFLPGNVPSAGTYRFRYVVNGAACPNDSATITMLVDDVVDAGMDASDTITDCTNPIDLNTYLSAGATAGGTWVDVSGSGALTGSSFDPSAAANLAGYDFRYVLTSGCGDDSSTVSLYLNCAIGLDEYSVGNIDVYPNPTQGEVTIETLTSDNKIKSVEVYSISGALLVKRSADDATVRIDLSNYADGLYNIKVTSERGIELHRINKK